MISSAFIAWSRRVLLAAAAFGLGYAGARRTRGIEPSVQSVATTSVAKSLSQPWPVPDEAQVLVMEQLLTTKNFEELFKMIEARPDLWMAYATRSSASEELRQAAERYAHENPRWALEHLQDLEPEAREPMLLTVLKEDHVEDNLAQIKATLGGRTRTVWLEELSPEGRAKIIGKVAGMETLQDPTKSLALIEGAAPEQQMEFFETVMGLSMTEPRLVEQKLLSAQGSPEARARIETALAVGGQGNIFNSPHDAICRATSIENPEVRHLSMAFALVKEKDPEVRQMTLDWLSAMPAGIVDKAQLTRGLGQMQTQWNEMKTLMGDQKKNTADDFLSESQFSTAAGLIQSIP